MAMAGTIDALQSTTLFQNNSLDYVFAALDPKSLILSQFSDSRNPNSLQLTTESFVMERGPRYNAYAQLRESKLRMKILNQQRQEEQDLNDSNLSPPKKQVKFQVDFPSTPKSRKGPSVLAQSVPDFSSALRKENRKPRNVMSPARGISVTPPASSRSSKLYGVGAKSGGSRSANAAEKRGGVGMIGRKSYANVEELKGLASIAGNAIRGENRGSKIAGRGGGIQRTILGYRQC